MSIDDQLFIAQLVARAGGSREAGKIKPSFVQLEAFKHLGRISEQDLKDWQADAGEEAFLDELADLLDKGLGWIFDGDGVALTLTRCPYPQLKDKGEKLKLFAPTDGMENITFQELGQVFTLYEKYLQDQDLDTFHQLLATIYRPPKPNTRENIRSGFAGDIRLAFLHHETTVKPRAKHLARLPIQVKQLLFLWIASCRQLYISSYDNVFKKRDPGPVSKSYSYGGVILRLAGGVVNIDQVASQNAHDVLVYLSMLEDDRRKQEIERARNRRR